MAEGNSDKTKCSDFRVVQWVKFCLVMERMWVLSPGMGTKISHITEQLSPWGRAEQSCALEPPRGIEEGGGGKAEWGLHVCLWPGRGLGVPPWTWFFICPCAWVLVVTYGIFTASCGFFHWSPCNYHMIDTAITLWAFTQRNENLCSHQNIYRNADNSFTHNS